jgi:hypothetical protein
MEGQVSQNERYRHENKVRTLKLIHELCLAPLSLGSPRRLRGMEKSALKVLWTAGLRHQYIKTESPCQHVRPERGQVHVLPSNTGGGRNTLTFLGSTVRRPGGCPQVIPVRPTQESIRLGWSDIEARAYSLPRLRSVSSKPDASQTTSVADAGFRSSASPGALQRAKAVTSTRSTAISRPTGDMVELRMRAAPATTQQVRSGCESIESLWTAGPSRPGRKV